jgi:hypothetical protein
MKKLMSACLIAVGLVLIAAGPGDAREGRGGSRGHGRPGVSSGASHWRGGGSHSQLRRGHSHWRGGHHHRSHGHHHRWHGPRVFFGIDPWWPRPFWHYPAYPYYVYSAPPVIVQQQPPVYIEQSTPPPPPVQQYWYYCRSAQAYYPTAPSCPEEWVKVPARSE